MKIQLWIIYTVIVGALPLLIRLICYVMMANPIGYAVSPIDLVFFGLTLNISNINELNGLPHKRGKNISSFDNIRGLSLVLIIFLCFTLGLAYANDLTDQSLLNPSATYWGASVLSFASLTFSWYVISKIKSCHGNS